MEVFPFTITAGQFLGDDVVIAGTDVTRKQSTCQVKIVDFAHDQHNLQHADPRAGKQRNMVIGEASLRGWCGDMELCGVPSIGKNYVAVAANDAECGSVSLLEVQSSPQHGLYQMSPVQCFEQRVGEQANITSLAYYSYHSHLAGATESGDVVVVDLASASDLTRQRMDPAGVRAVRYTQGGLVAALGQSNAGQLLLWDPRTAPGSSSGGGISGVGMSCHQRPLVSCSRGLGVTNRDSFLTCLETHPCHEHEFYCGTSTGSIVLWDIRKSDAAADSVVELERCQHNAGQAVTALAFRGAGRSPHVLSGAADGSVACVNYHDKQQDQSTVFRHMEHAGLQGGEVDLGFDQSTSAITSIQSHPQTDRLLVTSKLGEVNLLS